MARLSGSNAKIHKACSNTTYYHSTYPPWAHIVKQVHAFFYDCFAGTGAYDSEELGSPLIAGQILLDVQSKYRDLNVEFHVRNVEHNEVNYDKLAERTSPLENLIDIRNYNKSFHDALPGLLRELEAAGGERPALFFIDPFGYLDADPAPLKLIMSKPKREVLVNLMSYSLVRASGIDDAKIKAGIEKILGHSSFDTSDATIGQQVLEAYCTQFRNIGCFVCNVRIQSLDEPAVYFNLIHITRNYRGLLEMKRAMRKNTIHQLHEKQARANQLVLSFLEEFDIQMTMEAYEVQLVDFWAHKGKVSFVELITRELQFSPFDYGEIKETLNSLTKKGIIKIDGGSKDYLKLDGNTMVYFVDIDKKDTSIQLSLF